MTFKTRIYCHRIYVGELAFDCLFPEITKLATEEQWEYMELLTIETKQYHEIFQSMV